VIIIIASGSKNFSGFVLFRAFSMLMDKKKVFSFDTRKLTDHAYYPL